MKPGRDLDALVAEKVMELKTWIGDDENLYLVNMLAQVRRYSTDIAAAWEVVEKMQEKDFAIILDNMKNFLGGWQCQFERGKECVYLCEGESAAHAICLCALEAMGVEI